VQLVFTAASPPRELRGFEDRLRTRLESGLIVDLMPTASDDALAADLATADVAVPAGDIVQVDEWFLNREKVIWHWPYLHHSMVQELE
jgi:hypothetical protein